MVSISHTAWHAWQCWLKYASISKATIMEFKNKKTTLYKITHTHTHIRQKGWLKVTPFSKLRSTQVISDVMHNVAIFLVNDKLPWSTKLHSKSSTKGSVVHLKCSNFHYGLFYIAFVDYSFCEKRLWRQWWWVCYETFDLLPEAEKKKFILTCFPSWNSLQRKVAWL